MTIRQRAGALAATVLVAAVAGGFGAAAPASAAPAFSTTETLTRTHWVDGADQVVDTRHVTVTVSDTQSLRDRQAITVTWAGAHPTGGLVTDRNSAAAAQEEYPVVVMQCRGIDSPAAPDGQRLGPQTCWTQTPDERFQYSQSGLIYPPYRMDRYASTAERAAVVGQPDPLPAGCSQLPIPHWVPFVAADGTVYPGGSQGCAGMPPEAANAADSLQPGNTTYGVSDAAGDGSTKFVVQNADSNASLGCSETVACTLEIIPIIGVSCDAAGTVSDAPDRGLPANRRPPKSLVPLIFTECSRTGHFAPGSANGGGEFADLAVSGALWWSDSNWRNRIAVPLTFAASSSVCGVVSDKASAYLYGSEAMVQATQQWAPKFCLDKASRFAVRHVQTSEVQAKNLLRAGTIPAGIQAMPPSSPFGRSVVQAPAAVTGFGIAFSIDDAKGNPVRALRLNARLLAKLLSESYLSCAGGCFDFTSQTAVSSGFAALASNPIDMSRDPEFQALNPGIGHTNYLQSAATLAVMSSDSDVMRALTSYINADPDARAWLDGTADPWGMVVNPAYRGIVLPVDNWPLLDTHVAVLGSGANLCLTADPVPWLPLVAAPVLNPATVALNMQFDIANSQVVCKNNGQQNQKLSAVGREAAGARFLIGLVSLADAVRYQLNLAGLETHNTAPAGRFTDASGRTFAEPTDATLQAAAALLHPDPAIGSWRLPYDTLRTDSRGLNAYPGTMLISIDVPTSGLAATDAANYASLLRFVTGPGQTPGLGLGQLPPGYLSMTSAHGLGFLVDYTRRAADAVAAQKGTVPPLSGAAPTQTPKRAHRPASSVPSSSAPTSPPPPPAAPPTSAAVQARPSSRATTTTAAPSVAAAPVATTKPLNAGPLGLALPVLALVGGSSLAAAAWLAGTGRKR